MHGIHFRFWSASHFRFLCCTCEIPGVLQIQRTCRRIHQICCKGFILDFKAKALCISDFCVALFVIRTELFCECIWLRIHQVWCPATHCNTLHHTAATHYITLPQHTTSHCSIRYDARDKYDTFTKVTPNKLAKSKANVKLAKSKANSLCSLCFSRIQEFSRILEKHNVGQLKKNCHCCTLQICFCTFHYTNCLLGQIVMLKRWVLKRWANPTHVWCWWLYGVATVSRIDKIIGFFCRMSFLL